MNLLEHPIYKKIYDATQAVDGLPASKECTDAVILVGALSGEAEKLVRALQYAKYICLTETDPKLARQRIEKIAERAGATQSPEELKIYFPQ